MECFHLFLLLVLMDSLKPYYLPLPFKTLVLFPLVFLALIFPILKGIAKCLLLLLFCVLFIIRMVLIGSMLTLWFVSPISILRVGWSFCTKLNNWSSCSEVTTQALIVDIVCLCDS